MVEDDKKHGKVKAAEKKVRPMKTSSKPEVTDLIGQQLRKYYDAVADQPVPERFLHLLDKLDEATSYKKMK